MLLSILTLYLWLFYAHVFYVILARKKLVHFRVFENSHPSMVPSIDIRVTKAAALELRYRIRAWTSEWPSALQHIVWRNWVEGKPSKRVSQHDMSFVYNRNIKRWLDYDDLIISWIFGDVHQVKTIPRSCVVGGCTRNAVENTEVSFFQFPRDPVLSIEGNGCVSWPTQQKILRWQKCSAHFAVDCRTKEHLGIKELLQAEDKVYSNH